ncbi:hypothetical protein O181_021648 [Austropuccinia psidii MF-1]|uniref:Reverse transcriptase domain-containing protein n=1 Tax=Austropuccinia psidii MF-1 TaxID=1389203 RepID=A0A9Q3CFA7_9BASI|nr:hypothetical protein [Austropuccinia psidii MF-1]
MKESGHVSLYIADFRSLMSIIGDWGERAYIQVYGRGLASRFLDQLASHPGNFDSLQELMDITLELDTSNDFATDVSSVALVGELKTPYLPPSVHIPSIIPSQGYGPSSFIVHASLEEQWDEEEEPEKIKAVLNVVPPTYHQYFDLFSRVKAEKLPPHHACDHHIKLEGLLPSVGVIYSLSKHESETLWPYMLENLEKGLIRPSFSSTGAPVVFVNENDGGLSLCVDYCKLNAVNRKNRYPFPPINQLLNIFNGSTIFSKINLCGGYSFLRIKEGDEHLTAFRLNMVVMNIWLCHLA